MHRLDCSECSARLTLLPTGRTIFIMSKKPQKVDDPSSSYAVKKSAKMNIPASGNRNGQSDIAQITNKLFSERKELLRKLAQ